MSSSEANKINHSTGYQPSESVLCVNGCGFFGRAATMGLCSKCYRDYRIQEERAASAKAAVEELVRPRTDEGADVEEEKLTAMASVTVMTEREKKAAAVTNRCLSCNKKVGLIGFQCRCGCTFCEIHRYPEKHSCTFDFKGQGKDAIAKANPVIKAHKIDRI